MHASAGASASLLCYCYLPLPQKIQDFGEWEVPSVGSASAMATEEGGAQELSISYVLAATEQDRDAVQSYLSTLGAPN